ncbi:MAG TPA: acetate--CoA ligase family protein [Syntrophorhabdaceae bacterium]|jgi:acetyltransferase
MDSEYRPNTENYHALFKPSRIVVVGGSENLSKPGGMVLKNIMEQGYSGTLWVINPHAASVSKLPTFPSVAQMPGIAELAIIAVPAPLVASSLRGLAEKGTRAAIVLTAGFGEKDEEGRIEEMRLLDIADRANMILIGPNCSGFMTPHYSGKFAGIIPPLKPRSVDFISGSGATVDLVMEQALPRGLSFCTVINVGNSAQTGVEDLVALYDRNYGPESAPILMLYLESLRKPALLLEHGRRLTRKGCVIVAIKSGISGAGARAAASHTGAMANDDIAVESLFRKAGIIRVKSKMEMIDVTCVLAATGGRLKGKKVCVVTDAGGPGVMLTDELERQGFTLPVMNDATQKRLRRILPPESAVANPIDCLPTRSASQVREIFRIIEDEEGDALDVIAVQVANPGMSDNRYVYEEVADAMDNSSIPIIPVLTSVSTCAPLIQEFTKGGKSCFHDEVNLGSALGKVLRRPAVREASSTLEGYDFEGIAAALDGKNGVLDVESAAQVLTGAGFSLPRQVPMTTRKGLAEACEKVGFPLAMKVLGPLHKSDSAGVKVNISSLEAAHSAWRGLMAIKGAAGVLIQQMCEGNEVILGSSRSGDIGHVVMFGLGGIYTNTLKDVQFALAPLAKEECREMITGIKAFSILEGVRGGRGMSIDVLADYGERIGRLVTDFPAIREIDLNPVKGFDQNLRVVDGRIILD